MVLRVDDEDGGGEVEGLGVSPFWWFERRRWMEVWVKWVSDGLLRVDEGSLSWEENEGDGVDGGEKKGVSGEEEK